MFLFDMGQNEARPSTTIALFFTSCYQTKFGKLDLIPRVVCSDCEKDRSEQSNV